MNHHPHGLDDPTPIIDFIVRCTLGTADVGASLWARQNVVARRIVQDSLDQLADYPAPSSL